jgi:hypothetical protein
VHKPLPARQPGAPQPAQPQSTPRLGGAAHAHRSRHTCGTQYTTSARFNTVRQGFRGLYSFKLELYFSTFGTIYSSVSLNT